MRYKNVCLEAIAATLPEDVVTSAEIERRLAPLYNRLRLPEGRLELMTGIQERRFWSPDVRPSVKSIETAEKALVASDIERRHVGCLVHGSVCRDFLEPATAAAVHHGLGLAPHCAVYDVSNACLGLLNGMVQVANMIELGQIRAGLVVGTESARSLVESTIAQLNADESLTRQNTKSAFASLTIGSGSAAVLLCHRELSRTGNRLLGGALRAATEHCELCQGGHVDLPEGEGRKAENNNLPSPASGRGAGGEGDKLPSPACGRGAGGEGGPAGAPAILMATDSETLMREGVAAAQTTFEAFLEEMNWQVSDIQKTFCHQVGRAHRRLLFASLGLDTSIDYSTFERLGNTGSAALPTAAALGIESGHVQPGDRVALLGIGSGINVMMLGLEWGAVAAEIKRS